MMKKLLLLAVMVGMYVSTMGQTSFPEILENGDATLFEIKKAAKDYFNETGEKHVGWKYYQRWLFIHEGDFDADGHRIKRDFTKELAKLKKSKLAAKEAGSSLGTGSVWTELGPRIAKSTPSSTGAGDGIGRLSAMSKDMVNNIIYAVSPGGGVWTSSDDGRSWSAIGDQLPLLNLFAICVAPSNPTTLYCGGQGYGYIYKSTDAGQNWSTSVYNNGSLTNVRKILVDPEDENKVYVLATGGLYKTLNGGQSFEKMIDGTFSDITFKPGDNSVVYVTGNFFYLSTDGGLSFEQKTFENATRSMVAVTPANPNYVYLVTAHGSSLDKVYRSEDGGETFSLRLQASFDNATNYLGRFLNRSQNSQAWVHFALVVSQSNPDDLLLGGIFVYRSTDGGETFFRDDKLAGTNNLIHADNTDMEIFGDQVYSTNDGGMYTRTFAENGWHNISSNLGIRQFYRIGNVDAAPNFVIGGSQDNGTHTGNLDDLYDWVKISGGDGMQCHVDHTNTDIVYYSTQYGTLFREKARGQNSETIRLIKPADAGQGAWVTPYVMDPVNHKVLYAGYEDLYRSDDQGDTWTKKRDYANGEILHLEVSPANNNIVYLSGTLGSQVSHDASETFSWSNLPARCRISAHPTDEKRAVAYSSSKIYETINRGLGWKEITKERPNTRLTSIKADFGDDNGIFLGTDMGLYYTNDDMDDWQLVGEGLPNTPITDIKILYSINKIRIASYGRGVWETDYNSSRQSPYNGLAQTIPGVVEAEFYDQGGLGVAYYDKDLTNKGAYLRNDGVDLEKGTSNGNVAWIDEGEWFAMTVNVTQSGEYNLTAHVAAIAAGKQFYLEFDGERFTNNLEVPYAATYGEFKPVAVEALYMEQGTHVLTFHSLSKQFKVDDFEFTLANAIPDNDQDGYNELVDCDDQDATIYPGAEELCDGKDNDCDGQVDEGVLITFYFDQDNDLYGVATDTVMACVAPQYYVAVAGDCDDTRDNINPGAEELCDQYDNNCNGENNEGLMISQFIDGDNDGYGDPDTELSACGELANYVSVGGDCNDANQQVNPGTPEIADNGVDDNCDGQIDEGNDCVVDGPTNEYVISISENDTQLIIDWDGAEGMGTGFVYMDYWLNGSYQGSFGPSIDNANRIFGVANVASGTSVDFFFKYSAPYGQYLGAQSDHNYIMGTCSGTSKVSLYADHSKVKLTPNPVEDQLNITLVEGVVEGVFLVDGQGVSKDAQINKVGGSNITLDVSTLSTGIYHLQIQTNSSLEMVKFLKL